MEQAIQVAVFVGGLLFLIIMIYLICKCCKACGCTCEKDEPAADVCKEAPPRYGLEVEDFYSANADQEKPARKKSKKNRNIDISISSADGGSDGTLAGLPKPSSNSTATRIDHENSKASFYVVNGDEKMNR